jgi:hypothetical protein
MRLPVLNDAQGDTLLWQWRTYLEQMRRGSTPPSKRGFDLAGQWQLDGGPVEVTAHVPPDWWAIGGGAITIHGQRQDWQFGTHEGQGWQIDKVTPFRWWRLRLGGDVRRGPIGRVSWISEGGIQGEIEQLQAGDGAEADVGVERQSRDVVGLGLK